MGVFLPSLLSGSNLTCAVCGDKIGLPNSLFCSSITLRVPFELCFLGHPLSPFWSYYFAEHRPPLFKHGPACSQLFSFSCGCIKMDLIRIGAPYWTVQNASFCLSCLYIYHSVRFCVIYKLYQQQFYLVPGYQWQSISLATEPCSTLLKSGWVLLLLCALAWYNMTIACAYIYVLSLFKSSLNNVFAFGNCILEDLAISESCEGSFYWDCLGH